MPKGMTVLGADIKKARTERLMSQREFADALGLSVGGLQRIEAADRVDVMPSTIRRLGEFLGLDAAEAYRRFSADAASAA